MEDKAIDRLHFSSHVAFMHWDVIFSNLFHSCLEKYQSGNKDFNSYYSEEDLSYLNSIGYKAQEFFDFVEDFGDSQTPSLSTAILIAAARRDYFYVVQNKIKSDHVETVDSLPSKTDEFGGVKYLPRIIAKAEAKLRGELDPDIMYCCAGDRRFLNENGGIHPADFLRHVWASDGDAMSILEIIKSN